jgi:hypothetical protein
LGVIHSREFNGLLESLRCIFTEKSLKNAQIALSSQVWTATLVIRMGHEVQDKLETKNDS